MNYLFLFFLSIATCCYGLAQDQNQKWPEKPTDIEWAPIPYSMIKYTFWNAEKFINKTMGLTSEYCQYTSLRTNKTYSHKEVGACTYHHLIDSMYSNELQPSIYIWAKNNKNNSIVLKMDWRPHKGSLLEVLNSFLELHYENRMEMQRKIWSLFNVDTEKIQEKIKNQLSIQSTETLVGKISFKFKLDDVMWENIKVLFPSQLQILSNTTTNQISEIRVQMTPKGRSEYYLQNSVQFEILSPQSSNVIYGEIKTNVNILDTSRKFNASGQLTIGGDQ